MKTRGIFITFEGMDGSGKTTQMHRLAERLRSLGHTVTGNGRARRTADRQKIRRILLDSANQELSPTTEILLYFASRAQNVDEWILPGARARRNRALGPLHGFFPGLPGRADGAWASTRCNDLDRIACRGLKPDLTILVDVDAEASLARARARNEAEPHCETRMDDQSLEFHLQGLRGVSCAGGGANRSA